VPIEEFIVDTEVELGHEVNAALLDVIVLVIGLLNVSTTELILNIINNGIIKRRETSTYQLP
jgi:hypothetical protein